MLVLGLGLGMVMQVLVLAVQNAVPYEMLGVATSGSTLFRSIGGSLGTAVLGAVLVGAARRRADDRRRTPEGRPRSDERSAGCRLPAPVHDAYISAFTDALHVVFVVATAVVAVAFLSSWFIPERPLRAMRLVAARTDGLRILVADWQPDENPELDPLLRRLADELAGPA